MAITDPGLNHEFLVALITKHVVEQTVDKVRTGVRAAFEAELKKLDATIVDAVRAAIGKIDVERRFQTMSGEPELLIVVHPHKERP
jgi:urease gamma subunit